MSEQEPWPLHGVPNELIYTMYLAVMAILATLIPYINRYSKRLRVAVALLIINFIAELCALILANSRCVHSVAFLAPFYITMILALLLMILAFALPCTPPNAIYDDMPTNSNGFLSVQEVHRTYSSRRTNTDTVINETENHVLTTADQVNARGEQTSGNRNPNIPDMSEYKWSVISTNSKVQDGETSNNLDQPKTDTIIHDTENPCLRAADQVNEQSEVTSEQPQDRVSLEVEEGDGERVALPLQAGKSIITDLWRKTKEE